LLIALPSVYIKCNLWGRVEFKSNINPITVEICSSSTHPTNTTFTLAICFVLNHMLQPSSEPLPSLEGYGLKSKCLSTLRSTPATIAPPLPGLAHCCSMAELGIEKHKRGPRKWEAHTVHHETWATTFVMVHFHFPSSYLPPLTPLIPPPERNDALTLQKHPKTMMIRWHCNDTPTLQWHPSHSYAGC